MSLLPRVTKFYVHLQIYIYPTGYFRRLVSVNDFLTKCGGSRPYVLSSAGATIGFTPNPWGDDAAAAACIHSNQGHCSSSNQHDTFNGTNNKVTSLSGVTKRIQYHDVDLAANRTMSTMIRRLIYI